MSLIQATFLTFLAASSVMALPQSATMVRPLAEPTPTMNVVPHTPEEHRNLVPTPSVNVDQMQQPTQSPTTNEVEERRRLEVANFYFNSWEAH